MKLKDYYRLLLETKTSMFSRGFLFLILVLCFFSVNAQDVNVEIVNAPAKEEGLAIATLRITMSSVNLFSTLINYDLSGVAVEGDDFQTIGSLAIPSGQTEVVFAITPIQDLLIEGDEGLTFEILNSSDYNVGTDSQVMILIKDDDTSIVSITATDPNAKENTPANDGGTFNIDLGAINSSSSQIDINYSIALSSTATQPDDFSLSGTAVVLPSDQSVDVSFLPIDDVDIEGNESVTITLTNTSLSNSFIVNPATSATVTIEDNDCAAGATAPELTENATSFCGAFSVALDDYLDSAIPDNADLVWSTNSDPSVQGAWVPSTGGSVVSQAGTYYAFFANNANDCFSPTKQLTLTQNTAPSSGTPIANIPDACINNDSNFTPRSLDLDDLITGEDAGDWEQTGGPSVGVIPNNNRINFDNRAADIYKFTYTTTDALAPCSNESTVISITAKDCDPCVAGNDAPTQNNGVLTTFCGPIINSLDDYASNSGPNGTVLRWALSTLTAPVSASDFIANNSSLENNPLPGTYYGYYFDATNSCVSPELEITLLSNTIPSITAASGDERCAPGIVNLTAAASKNATINWYTAATGGIIAGTGANFSPNLSQTTTYYVEATLNDCASSLIEPREEVVATIVPQPSAGVIQNNGNASSCSFKDNGPTLLDLDDVISGQDAGEWVFTSGPVADFSISNDNLLDFEGFVDGDYVFTYTTSGAQAPCLNESSIITISVNDCDVDTDLDGLFDGPEAILGTLPDNPDTDGDGINDGDEVGTDIENPIDSDGDGKIDALDSNIIDSDMDGVVDQLDPGNDNPCVPDNSVGLCDTDEDGISDGVEIANGSDHLDPCSPNIDPVACVDPEPVDLEIKKEVDNPDAMIGDAVTFTITLNNLTASKAKAITIGELLESGFEYIEHEASLGTYDVTTGEWYIFEIEPSGTATLTIKVTIVEGADSYMNTAELLSSFPIDVTDDNNKAIVEFTFEIPEGINLEIEKKVSLGLTKEKLDALTGLINTIDNELEVFYFIKVINKSNQDPVSNIRVLDAFMNEDIDFEISQPNVPSESTFNEITGEWFINKTLEVGQEIELSYRVTFKEVGIVTNLAVIDRSSPRESLDSTEDNDSSATATVTITTRNIVDVGILYNEFSPNNDGLNDDLKINLIRTNDDGTEELITNVLYNIQIFNRYGNLVFETSSQSTEEIWNGSWKGKDSPDGTYFYTMQIEIEGEGAKTQKGWIQLVR